MSYEGYSQFWCGYGHYWTKDCNLLDSEIIEKCPECGHIELFENQVDETNGSWEDGERIDGFIEPQIKSETSGICSACEEKHICNVTYKVPDSKQKGTKK